MIAKVRRDGMVMTVPEISTAVRAE